VKLLNLGCGAVRPQDPEWRNLDNLHAVLAPGTPERTQLDSEQNYVNHDISTEATLPFRTEGLDGVLCSHVIEHFDCHAGAALMRECHRILKPGGVLLVSVPDAAVFRKNWDYDNVENAERLYGEPIHLPDGETDFMSYAGFNRFHKVLLNEDSLWCYFVRAGFRATSIYDPRTVELFESERKMVPLLNRLPFSLIMAASKNE